MQSTGEYYDKKNPKDLGEQVVSKWKKSDGSAGEAGRPAEHIRVIWRSSQRKEAGSKYT